MTRGTNNRTVRGWRRFAQSLLFFVVLGSVLAASIAVWQSDGGRPLRPRLVASGTPPPSDVGVDPATAEGTIGSSPSPLTATPAPVPTSPSLRTPAPEQPLDVWFSGDSTAFAIGSSLGDLDDAGLLEVELSLMTSSGLARPDFFDWPAHIASVLETGAPEVMILSIGANDLQPLQSPDGSVHTDVHADGWGAEYERRVEEITQVVTGAGTTLYWVGQPIARDAEYDAGLRRINGLLHRVADRHDDAGFIDTYGVLAGDDLTYVDSQPGPDGQPQVIRRPDGVHLTLDGGAIVAETVAERLRRDWGG